MTEKNTEKPPAPPQWQYLLFLKIGLLQVRPRARYQTPKNQTKKGTQIKIFKKLKIIFFFNFVKTLLNPNWKPSFEKDFFQEKVFFFFFVKLLFSPPLNLEIFQVKTEKKDVGNKNYPFFYYGLNGSRFLN